MRIWCAVALLSHALPALAQEPVRLRVETRGDCPTSEALEHALQALDIGTEGVGEQAWVVRAIHRATGPTRLELWEPGAAAPVEQREIASSDCDTLAQTFALIVQTHFTELGVQVAPPTPPPDPYGPSEHEPSVEVAPPVPSRWEIALSAAGGISLEPLLPSLLGQLDVSFLPSASGPFVVRALFAATVPTTQGMGSDAVTRWALRPGIQAGARFGSPSVWFQVLGGFLLELAPISVTDVPIFLRAQPGLDLALALGIALGGSWSLRIESSLQAWLTYDRYYVDASGIVARSPWGSAVLGLALLCAFDS